MKDLLGYKGKTAVIAGCAPGGMGEAAAVDLKDLGANVYALDINKVTAPVKKYIPVDMLNRESMDEAVRQLPAEIDCFFCTVRLTGRSSTLLETTMVNFVGIRYLTEMLTPRIKFGGGIAIIGSTQGSLWPARLNVIKEFLSITEYEKQRAWLEAHKNVNDGYPFSKECLIVYAKLRAPELAKRNIRINVINPGVTESATMLELAKAHPEFKTEILKMYPERADVDSERRGGLCDRNAKPEEMGRPLIFLNSNLATYITGQDIYVDAGWKGAIDIGLKRNWARPENDSD